MANEDNTQHNGPTNGNSDKILAILQELAARMTNVEEIIQARLNTTRPFEGHAWTTRFDEVSAKIDRLINEVAELRQEQVITRNEVAELRQEQVATRQELALFRKDFDEFRAETNENFRLNNKQLGILSQTFLKMRAEHELLEERVTKLEDRAA